MKNYTYLLALCMALSIQSFAQPVSGYLGKRMAASFEFQIIPGFQGDYETNTSTFLAFMVDSENGFSYVPRWLANFEYQYKRNAALSVGLGAASMNTNAYFLVKYTQTNSYDEKTVITPLNTIFLQIRTKKGIRNMIMPTASSYIAYGIGLYSITQPAFSATDKTDSPPYDVSFDAVRSFDISFNFEFGRRAVFNHGIFLEYGIVTNLSRGLLYSFKDPYNTDYSDPDYMAKQNMGRVALNSLLNLKLAIGILY